MAGFTKLPISVLEIFSHLGEIKGIVMKNYMNLDSHAQIVHVVEKIKNFLKMEHGSLPVKLIEIAGNADSVNFSYGPQITNKCRSFRW